MTTSTAASGERLRDIATFVRSKNAGPFMLTIDIFFASDEECRHVIDSDVLAPRVIADIYGVAHDEVRIIHMAAANAVKISFPRPFPAGDVGDRDVAGGQQFAPLLDLVVPTR